MSSLTANGFVKKSYDEYVEKMQQQAKELFGSDVDLSDYSPIGQWVKMLAYERVESDELAEAVFNSAYVDTAEGVALDYAVKYKSISRFPEQPAIGEVTFEVDPGLTVPAGLWVGTPDGVNFFVTDTVIDSDNDGFVTASIEALEPGSSGNVPANTITEIATPLSGINAVNNPLKTEQGRDKETDAELRNRYYATSGDGSTLDGITSALLNTVPGVRAAVVIENVNDTPDSSGRPPHSFESIVLGGQPADIGAVILSKKPAAIQAYGSETIIVKDISGNDQTIGFSYAAVKNIHVKVDIVKETSFPSNGADMVELEVIKYIGGTDRNSNSYAGLGMGDDVVLGKIASNIFMNVPGVKDATVQLSIDGVSYDSNNVLIDQTEVAETSYDKLVITVA